MQHVPLALHIAFAFLTLLAAWLFCRAMPNLRATWTVILVWIAVQGVVALSGFYTITTTLPPRFILLVAPPLVLIALLFVTPRGRQYLDALDPAALTLVHVVRIPVELVLFALCIYKTIPQGMTFEGSNFDILSGLTAPLIWWFG
ncbi:MAG: hypothetical protein ABI432_03335 [Flavobacteriales bacterium]